MRSLLAWTWTFCEWDLFGRVKRARRALLSQSILVTDVFAPFHLPFTGTFYLNIDSYIHFIPSIYFFSLSSTKKNCVYCEVRNSYEVFNSTTNASQIYCKCLRISVLFYLTERSDAKGIRSLLQFFVLVFCWRVLKFTLVFLLLHRLFLVTFVCKLTLLLCLHITPQPKGISLVYMSIIVMNYTEPKVISLCLWWTLHKHCSWCVYMRPFLYTPGKFSFRPMYHSSLQNTF